MSRRLFVQFLHPGGEYVTAEAVMAWNTNNHHRKFLVNRGKAVRGDKSYEGEVAFWGEWEPQSDVELVQSPVPGGPSRLHRPFYTPPDGDGWRQNTDPCVFGGFRYTCCQQHFRGRPSTLQSLGAGSLVLFGSRVDRAFVLDTLLVVKDDGVEHDAASFRSVLASHVPRSYFDVTLDPWYADPDAGSPCRLYEGATSDDPYQEMFSFFPALAADDAPAGFARPRIKLDGMISIGQSQGRKFTELAESQVAETWRRIVDQVEASGLWLGTSAVFPPRR